MRSVVLPRYVFFFLDVGIMVTGVNETGDGHIATDKDAICHAYGAAERVIVNVDYTQEGRFTLSNWMKPLSSDESDSSDSTDPDYRTFLAGYNGSDDDSTNSDAGSGSVVTQ